MIGSFKSLKSSPLIDFRAKREAKTTLMVYTAVLEIILHIPIACLKKRLGGS
jgi:hypothetical protein